MDPAYPRERLAYMLEDARPAVLVTQQGVSDWLGQSAAGACACLYLDTQGDVLDGYAGDNLDNLTRSAHLAYVIYTSGSTGKPKGVEGPHGAMVNRLRWMQRAFDVRARKHAQKTSINFIDSVTETLAPLVSGETLHIVSAPLATDPHQLWRTGNDQG